MYKNYHQEISYITCSKIRQNQVYPQLEINFKLNLAIKIYKNITI